MVVEGGGEVGVERRGRVWLIRDFRAVISEVRGFKAIGIFCVVAVVLCGGGTFSMGVSW